MIQADWIKKHPKIAVLDTGIQLNHAEFCGKKIEWVPWNHKQVPMDENGHGTSCTAEILHYDPRAEIVMIPVLDENKSGNLLELCKALAYCLEREDIGIVSLSLSCTISDMEVVNMFHELVQEIKKMGKLVVAADDNDYSLNKVFPFAFSEVLGVTRAKSSAKKVLRYQQTGNKCHFRVNDNMVSYLPEKNGMYAFHTGTSCLTAKLVGLLSYALRYSSMEQLSEQEAIRLCQKRLCREKKKEKYMKQEVSKFQIEKVEMVREKILHEKQTRDRNKRNGMELNLQETTECMRKLEQELGITSKPVPISLYDFWHTKRLAAKLYYNEK